MAFTESSLQAALDTAVSGLGCKINRYDDYTTAATTTITVQNLNTSTDKTGTCQVAQTNNATQAAAAVLAALS